MIVDHSHSLHEGITNLRSNKLQISSFQFPAHQVRFFRLAGNLPEILPGILNRPSPDEIPQIGIKRTELVLDF